MLKDAVEIFNALLTPLIAVLTAYIAWQQYRIQHRTLSGQMYERKYFVFKAFMSFFADIMREGMISYQRLSQFYAEASEADFLFTDAISGKREDLHKRGVDFALLQERLYPSDKSPGLPDGAERSKAAEEKRKHLEWFIEQISETRQIFKIEMRIH